MSIESERSETTPNRDARPAERGLVTAVVRVAGRDTAYRRAGAGAPVLLLRSTSTASEDPLLVALASRFLVIIPETVPVGDEPHPIGFEEWLDGLIEGLGLERPCLVADQRGALDLLSFVTHHPERAAGTSIVLLDRPHPIGSSPDDIGELLRLVTLSR